MRPLIPVILCLATPVMAESVPPSMFHCIDPNLEVTVWASSPMLRNPTNIDIDKDGRIWVAEGVDYRSHYNRQPEGDRIMVLEDTDGDGQADKSWPFVQEPFLRAPLGVAVIGNKVVVSMAPDLVVYTDTDGDLKFDSAKGDTREVLLTGFNGRKHDHSLHSVTVGPDGKWYFSCGNAGAQFTDKSGKTFRMGSNYDPYNGRKGGDLGWNPQDIAGQKSDDGHVWVGGFIARMNPDGTNVEILAHGLRNSYENCVTSFGDIFASDNDDQPACRTFWVLEGGFYGFTSRDGKRGWQVDRRPGQSIATATWRQEDPGVAPAGDIYGGGSPTGCVFYENGALGEKWEGTLLVCESARNTIFGYKPQPDGAGWKLERFDFLTTNKAGDFAGADFKGGKRGVRADDTKTLFRPSDIAVGPDGALYISDWYDPRVGGHADLDEGMSGTIYRVAPKGYKPKVPKFDLATVEGAVEALKSPAVNVRALGAEKLRKERSGVEASTVSSVVERIESLSKFYIEGRFCHVAPAWPKVANERLEFPLREGFELISHSNAIRQGLLRAQNTVTRAQRMAARGEDIGSLAENLAKMAPMFPMPIESIEWGLLAGPLYKATSAKLEVSDPLNWSAKFAAIAWRLHPPQSVPAFKARALATTLPEKARLDALTAIGFNDTAEAAQAMLEVAEKATGLVRDTALWWLLNRKDNDWKAHNLNAALKERGIYDPDKVQLVAASLPEPPPAAFSVADAMKLKGDAKRGETVSQKCYLCHRIGANGVDFGPDLTTWGRTQTTEVILRSLIDPGADIAHGFAGTQIETTDGLTIQGLLLSDSDPVVIRSMGGITQTVPKAKIKTKKGMDRSLMMSATQQGLTAQEAADVVAFLKKQ